MVTQGRLASRVTRRTETGQNLEMGEILKTWIRTRLGVIMDLSPEIFGHYTRDGNLLAQILHSYDIITRDQLATIIRTQDPALCRVNLKLLRLWLRFLGIDCDDGSIEEISRGRGTTSLCLFYKLYLTLESKDRLHFVTLEKEREKYLPTSTKFDVTVVCEDPPPYEPPEHPLSKRLCEGKETVEWHHEKLSSILRSFKKERERFESARIHRVNRPVVHTLSEESTRDARKEVSEQLDQFAKKHKVRGSRTENEDRRKFEEVLETSVEDPVMAKAYVDWLKDRKKRMETYGALKSKMQKSLLSEVWQKIDEKRDREADEVLARRVLDQSRYEKQMMTKLSEARAQKDVITENRKIVEELVSKAKEQERRMEEEREAEALMRDAEDVEMECRRMCELRCRMREEKARRIREKHRTLCLEALEDLVDLALKAAEYRRANDGQVPRTIWSEWKALFVRCQPVFDEEMDIEEEEEGGEEEDESPSKFQRMEALRQAAFQDYLEMNAPWDEFVPSLDEKTEESLRLGRVVLGYIVHRLLEYIYPWPEDRKEAPVPRLDVTALVQGLANPELLDVVQTLLEKAKIRLVRVEDAINYCLECYKNEMSDWEYIDSRILAATATVTKPPVSGSRSRTEGSRKGQSPGRSRKGNETPVVRQERDDKQTQTPRVIPYDDLHPVLTNTAFIGKWAYEFLTLGQPISVDLEIKILMEYLKNLTDVEGWALIDYPNTYEQLTRLEAALTGRSLPPDPQVLDFKNVNIEDIDPVPPRIVFEDDNVDIYALKRQSRLVPNPIVRRDENASATTFVKTYVKVLPKPKDTKDENSPYEKLQEDSTSVDKFYVEQTMAYAFYYSVFDLSTLKDLAKLLMGKWPSRTPSQELFGDILDTLKREFGRHRDVSKQPIVRRLVSKDGTFEDDEMEGDDGEDEEEQKNEELLKVDERKNEVEPRSVKPGEEGWIWIDLPIPSAIRETLALLWEHLEEIYVEDLKEIFFLKSLHSSSVVPYKDLVSRNAKEFIERPDNRQDFLRDFQRAYNSIDEDFREDVDVKCELHRRVADLQSTLWEICDRKRHEAEEERRRLIRDRWIIVEASVLFNVYIGILQAEGDRFVDTMRLVQDYYASMLQKQLQESGFLRVQLDRMELDKEDPVNFQERPIEAQKSVDRKEPGGKIRAKAATPKGSTTPPAADQSRFENEITELLIDAGQTAFDPVESSLYKLILENVRYVRGIVDCTVQNVNETIRKEDASISKSEARDRGSKTGSPHSISGKLSGRGADFVLEWRYAVTYEICRIRRVLELLTASARADVAFLVDTTRETFHRFHDNIVDRYKREIKSVNDMANVFCFAIEEARSIEDELLLEGDRFLVKHKALSLLEKIDSKTIVEEEVLPSEFRIAQLARLLLIFRHVAPAGKLTERALVYILQDLISQDEEEECQLVPLPVSWRRFQPDDAVDLVDRLFGPVEYIDWREFIVHAMDLPVPSQHDILTARNFFRNQDPELKELVTTDQYRRTPLWFLECTETSPGVHEILQEIFQRDVEDLYDEELPGKDRDTDSIYSESKMKDTDSGSCESFGESKIRESLRAMLAKELLRRMYLTGRDVVNYTALLLAFCKDEDPREGLAKALALAMGNRICTDVQEGERYAEELLKQKRRASDAKRLRESLYREALQVLEELVDKATRGASSSIVAPESLRSRETSSQRARLTIQSLDEPGHEYPIEFQILESASPLMTDTFIEEQGNDNVRVSNDLMMPESWHRSTLEDVVIYWVPRDVCLAVLAAALPWHVTQPDLFETSRSLREGVALVYEELKDKRLDDGEDSVLAHRLLNHEFITMLLGSTSKFTVKHMGNVVREILRQRENGERG